MKYNESPWYERFANNLVAAGLELTDEFHGSVEVDESDAFLLAELNITVNNWLHFFETFFETFQFQLQDANESQNRYHS